MAAFGEYVRELRKQAGLTQEQLAVAAGLSPSYISTIERDQPHSVTGAKITPEREKVVAIVKALKGDPVVGLLLCGYSASLPADDDTGESFEIADNVRVSMHHGKKLTEAQRKIVERNLARAFREALDDFEFIADLKVEPAEDKDE